jgi:hypothetical protein
VLFVGIRQLADNGLGLFLGAHKTGSCRHREWCCPENYRQPEVGRRFG